MHASGEFRKKVGRERAVHAFYCCTDGVQRVVSVVALGTERAFWMDGCPARVVLDVSCVRSIVVGSFRSMSSAKVGDDGSSASSSSVATGTGFSSESTDSCKSESLSSASSSLSPSEESEPDESSVSFSLYVTFAFASEEM